MDYMQMDSPGTRGPGEGLAGPALPATADPLASPGAHARPEQRHERVSPSDRVAVTASFGARLRRERERRRVSIASIAESTKILGALLEGLERDDVSRWPSGLYRRAFIRAYATAIGLDPEPVVREFLERFPDSEEPVRVPAPARGGLAPAAPRAPAVLRLTLADSGGSFSRGHVLRHLGRRLRAIVFDAAVLGIIALSLLMVLDDFWAPLSLAIASYYGLSILLLGNTPGVTLLAPGPRNRR